MTHKRVTVTGGAGFLGSHVAKLLLEGDNEVTIIDDFSNGKRQFLRGLTGQPGLRVFQGDIRSPRAVRAAFADCQVIIHLAVLCLRESIRNPRRVTAVIVDGTINCLDAARRNGAELFVNCSSSEAYGSALRIPMDEAHPLNPETPYAAAKVAQDMLVSSYGRTYGLPWTTVRPFNMYGPNSHWQGLRGEVIPKMIVRAMNRKPLVVFGDGLQTRDFTYVEDAAMAVLSIASSPHCVGQLTNVCTGAETSILTIAGLICDAFSLDPDEYIQFQPARPGDVQRHLGDNAKLKSLFGFVPRVDFPQGLCRTISWFRHLPDQAGTLLSQEVLRAWE